jgi:hypothetical protein
MNPADPEGAATEWASAGVRQPTAVLTPLSAAAWPVLLPDVGTRTFRRYGGGPAGHIDRTM